MTSKKFESELAKVKEGKTEFIAGKADIVTKHMPVFYNPKKEFDRTLSIEILKLLKPQKVLDLLSASGARGIRIAIEVPSVKFIHFNDVNPEAVKLIKKNILLNKISQEKVKISQEEANKLCVNDKNYYDFIDIDPFGSPINFIFNALCRLDKEGILAVTATDTAPLYGVYKMTCFRKYGSYPIKTKFSHEVGLRILAKAVIEIGAKRNISLIPIFAHATMHYYRIYFKAKRSYVNEFLKQLGWICYCPKCKNRFFSSTFHDLCSCGNKLESAGLLYGGNLWDLNLVEKLIKENETSKTLIKFLERVYDEAKVNIPYFYEVDEFKESSPLEILLDKLKKAGFKASRTHFSGKGIKTDASFKQMEEIFKK